MPTGGSTPTLQAGGAATGPGDVAARPNTELSFTRVELDVARGDIAEAVAYGARATGIVEQLLRERDELVSRACSPPPVGATVVAHGVSQMAELNGRRGVVVGRSPADPGAVPALVPLLVEFGAAAGGARVALQPSRLVTLRDDDAPPLRLSSRHCAAVWLS